MADEQMTTARKAALAFARTIVPGLKDEDLYRIHDAWGGYWQITVPSGGGFIPYQFGNRPPEECANV
jgi:hypothetical protein